MTRVFSFLSNAIIILGILSIEVKAENSKCFQKEASLSIVVSERKIWPFVTQKVYSDGTVRLFVEDRDGGKKKDEPLTFIRSPEPANLEPEYHSEDYKRGYVVFVPKEQDGVLPEYRPATSEIKNEIDIFASPGESEPVTFCVRPLRDIGRVSVEVMGKDRILPYTVYVVRPSVEQTDYSSTVCRWTTKWIEFTNIANSSEKQNLEFVVDINVSEDTRSGDYTIPIKIHAEKGGESQFLVNLKVLPVKLAPSMPWGIFAYASARDENGLLSTFKILRQYGVTGVVMSYTVCPNSTVKPVYPNSIFKPDGKVDLSAYDRSLSIYRKAGFVDPPIISMESLFGDIAAAKGKTAEFKIAEGNPGIKADDIPDDIREFSKKIVRRIYDYSIKQKWPPFYVYFADEPLKGIPVGEKARFMLGVARECAPELQTASTIYTLESLKYFGNVDLDIANYIHPCANADSNRRWHEAVNKLYGIDFIGGYDTLWQVRQMAMLAEKGKLEGMRFWLETPISKMEGEFEPYYFLKYSWKGGPWIAEFSDGRKFNSMAFLGLREGADDSRYIRTAVKAIEDTKISFDSHEKAIGEAAEKKLVKIMERIPWVQEANASYEWSNYSACIVRKDIAQLIMELQNTLKDK
ncbi:MAG: hypothetical protein LLF92_07150 [Planctomycetaceae bacterium]|nr:hypothetical protein [Planctomycetaceae bacterium]